MLLLALVSGVDLVRAAPITALSFSPDGSTLASVSGNKVALHGPKSGAVKKSLPGQFKRLTTLAFQPKGVLLAVGGGTPGEKGGVQLLDWRKGEWLGSIATNSDVVTCVAFNGEGKLLAVASADQSVTVYRVEGDAKLAVAFSLSGHSGAVQAVAFSPDGTILLTASVDRSLKVWSVADGKLLRSFGQHTDAVQALAFRPIVSDRPDAPAYCASGGDDRTVRVWQPSIGRMVRIVRRHEGPVLALAFTPDGRALFSAGKEGIIRRIDADSDEVLGARRGSEDWIYSLAISPDGKTLATGDWGGKVSCRVLTGADFEDENDDEDEQDGDQGRTWTR
ncbi:MAG: WD40 repeat domain-containing protein [Verrucomicrobiota bacterium]